MPSKRCEPTARVLVVATHPLGGIRSYLLNNVPRLMEAGYCFTFLSPEGEAFDAFKNDVESWPGVELVGVPVSGRRFSLWPSVRRAIRTRRYSLIHSQGLRAGVEVAFANYFARVPHIITLHDTRHDDDFKGRLRWLKRQLAERLAMRADAIIAVSNDCAQNHFDFFPRWKRSRCRVEVIDNGVDVERLKTSAARAQTTLRTEFGWNGEIQILGYFGRLMPEKGFLILLDALRELARRGLADRVRLVATKDPHGYLREYMREVERDNVLARMVRFVEPVPDIATLLPQIDVLVMPSLHEACPLLPMEAMCVGVPVLGTDCPGLREVLNGTPSRMVAFGDPEALAKGLRDAVIAPWGKQAREYVTVAHERYDVRHPAAKLADLFQQYARVDNTSAQF